MSYLEIPVLNLDEWRRPSLQKARVRELNASDERGINVVREKIKGFAATSVGQPAAGYPCPPFKLLILDEADSMTQVGRGLLQEVLQLHSEYLYLPLEGNLCKVHPSAG